jgi:hypothetical protein
MAAVTLVARSKRIEKWGLRWVYLARVSGADTNTYDTGIKSVKTLRILHSEDVLVTAVAPTAVNSQWRLTFSATAPFTNLDLVLIAG